MNSVLSVICFFICSAKLVAQDAGIRSFYPIANIELSYLYKAYDNKLAYAAPEKYDTTIVEADVPAVINYISPNKVTVNIGNVGRRDVSISVLGVNGRDTSLISTQKFRVKTLPAPSVYLVNAKISGSGAFVNEPVERMFTGLILLSKYPPEIQLEDQFKVIEWKITVGDVVYEGQGNTISEEVCDAIYNSEKGTIVRINSVKVESTYREFDIDIPLTMYKESEIRTFRPTKYTPIICE